MWIRRIEIRGFGCLEGRTFDFPEGRAVLVIADNEQGKSTLASAIIAGLCGFPKRKQSEEPIKQSEVFRPWSNNAYSVGLLLDAAGRQLAVERDFDSGRFQVRDAATNKDVTADFSEDLTESLLALPRDDFRRIAVIAGKDVHRFESSVGLKSRLEALVEGTDASNAEAAIAAIEDARYVLDDRSLKVETAKARLAQQIQEKQNEISRLDTAIDDLRPEEEVLEQSRERLRTLDRRTLELDAEYESARLTEAREELQAAKRSAAAGIALAALGFASAAASALAGLAGIFSPAAAAAGGIVMAAVGVLGLVLALSTAARNQAASRQLEGRRENRGPADLKPRPSWTVDAERRGVRSERDQVVSRIISLEKRIGAALDNYRNRYPLLRQECERLQAEQRKAARYSAALEAASEAMREVLDTVRRRWASALNGLASGILPHLNPDYDTLLFDSNLDFTIRHAAANRILQKKEIDSCLSTGAKDQVYLAVRLACAQALSSDEAVPLILDDPFVYFDDARFESALRCVVEKISPEQQAIILSCHKGRHERLLESKRFADRVEVLRLEPPAA